MENIIEWANNNNGFIISILTLIYVVATIFICCFNCKSAKETRNQIEESRKQFKATNRPYIIPCFTEIEGAMFCLAIRNIGNECAKNLSIKINKEWLSCFSDAIKQKKMPGDMIKALKNKFFLSPNDELKFVLLIPGDGTTMYHELCKEKIKINFKYYRNDLSENFDENFELDLLTMSGLIVDKSDYIRKMEKQEKVLKDIAKNLKCISNDINIEEKNNG